jgi:hypothetical protein
MTTAPKLKVSLTLSADVVALVDHDARRLKDTRSGIVEQWLRLAANASVGQEIEDVTAAYYRSLSGEEDAEDEVMPNAPTSSTRRVAYDQTRALLVGVSGAEVGQRARWKMANSDTPEVVLDYYDSWKNGIGSFDEMRLRGILAADLKFEGPIAGKKNGAEDFLSGLIPFVKTLKAHRILQTLHAGNEAAVLYDCDLTAPSGTFRFAEFFRVERDKIQEIKLVFDATESRKLGAR